MKIKVFYVNEKIEIFVGSQDSLNSILRKLQKIFKLEEDMGLGSLNVVGTFITIQDPKELSETGHYYYMILMEGDPGKKENW
eukprot:CAMPEP_0170540134 /NCGR_PEP_ID=MMETSP0211-20121228/163_1 /TAXON_ID=311385 /ORGANISM="Pseudokeronopsis sp., Strain OXSARD2" /LENGTH=81 /DNA_ID=CAMNT_0010842423 /DNA_START=38 /DNA_END=280 /DNA_ORIENTATION=+